MKQEKLLQVKNLHISFWTNDHYLHAIDDVSFTVYKGEVLGIVGESGCGKSVTADAILQLHDEAITDYEGSIVFEGTDLLSIGQRKLEKLRGNDIAMIFQDPMSSLNPVFTIGQQLMESLIVHKRLPKKEAKSQSIELLRQVGIPSPELRMNDYPHQLSGGMRQRVMIAMALSCKPKLLVADEPTTALDVTIQSQILHVMKELQVSHEMAMILITHDLGVVAEVCDRIVVMYLGQVIEVGTVQDIFERPLHPYTSGLLQSMPHAESDRTKPLYEIKGSVPTLANIPLGCRFANRCAFVTEKCVQHAPKLERVNDEREVRCWHTEFVWKEAERLEA